VSDDGHTKWIARAAERMQREVRESVPLLERLGDAVLFLGGHRLPSGHPLLEVASEAATLLSGAGYALRVGRDDGVARAIAEGARRADASSEVQGLLLDAHYRDEERRDGEPIEGLRVHQRVTEAAAHRWLLLTRAAAIVALPGGLGTIELLFAALGDAARRSVRSRPVVLVGSHFWEPFIDQLAVSEGDEPSLVRGDNLRSIVIVEDANELYDAIEDVLPLTARDDDEAPVRFAAGGRVIAGSRTRMATPPGPTLSSWMIGEVHEGVHELSPGYGGRGREDDEIINRNLKGRARELVDERSLPPAYLGWALRGRVGRDELARLIKKGAGPEAIAFLYFAAPYTAYRRPSVIARRVLDRWGDKAEALFERINILARSRGLTNPDALKSWTMGIASRDLAAEGFAVMIYDAVDLVEAGHEIALERGAGGNGDILDLTEKVAYQHKRVGGRSLGQHIKKAVKQLCGWNNTPGAPEGYRGVAQIDARSNHHYGRFSDKMLEDLVGDLELETTERVDRIQVLLDDRMLIFGPDLKLKQVERRAEAFDRSDKGQAAPVEVTVEDGLPENTEEGLALSDGAAGVTDG
jgi:predicted Rossmann-fold nucleotide-binding protein